MKFSISSGVLSTAVLKVMKAQSNRNAMPILDCVLIESVGDTQITLTASDSENLLNVSVPADVAESGAVAIESKLLAKCLKEISEQPIVFDVTENNSVNVQYSNGHFNFLGQSAKDFPIPGTEGKNYHIDILSNDLIDALNAVAGSVANDDLRPQMNGVYFDVLGEDGVVFVASDGHTLAKHTVSFDAGCEPFAFIIPSKAVNIIKSMLARDNRNVGISTNHNQFSLFSKDFVLTGRLIEGRYPNYNSVLPQSCSFDVFADRRALLSALKRIQCFSASNNLCKFEFTDNALCVSSQDIDFSVSAQEDVAVECEGSGQIGLNISLLIDILARIVTPKVGICYIDEKHAITLHAVDEENQMYENLWLVMPMML